MANHKSAEKRQRQNEKRRLRNRSRRSQMKNICKKVEAAILENDFTLASTLYVDAARTLDKAVSWGVIHKNGAARKKSRLIKKVRALQPTEN